VVDDDETMHRSIGALLEDEGYAVLHAWNGAEALDMLRTVHEPLVVLLDWMMPCLDGLGVLEAACDEPARLGRHAYILSSAAFPSGLNRVPAFQKSLHLDILVRPFTIALVLEKVAQAAAWLQGTARGKPGDRRPARGA
jgi:two-component system, chemotaxis family, chemotaxis protein CheY